MTTELTDLKGDPLVAEKPQTLNGSLDKRRKELFLKSLQTLAEEIVRKAVIADKPDEADDWLCSLQRVFTICENIDSIYPE